MLAILNVICLATYFTATKSEEPQSITQLHEYPFKDSSSSISPLVMYHVARLVYPKTIRILLDHSKATNKLSFRNSNYSIESETEITDMSIGFSQEVQNIPRILGNNRLLLRSPDPRSVSTGRMIGLIEGFRYVVIIFFNKEDTESMERILANMHKTSSPRWDRIVIITKTNAFLQILMKHKRVLGLKERHLISLDNLKSIWTDPLLYDGGKMIHVESVDLIPDKELVGGNLNGRHLIVSSCEFRPWVYVIGKDKDGRNLLSGSHYKIVEAGAPLFNYTFEVNLETSYGEFWEENQSWTGAYGRIFYPDQAHFVLYLSYEYDWNYGVDFATTFDECELMFLTNQPITKLEWYAFLQPLQLPVWAWTVTFFIVLGIVQFFVMYFYHNRQLKYIVIDTAAFLPYAMAMEQGLCEIPKGARYLALIWLMGCVVIGTGYKATLRERMSYPRAEVIPLTFEELSERQDYKITLYTLGSLERFYFEESPWPAIINIRERMGYDYNSKHCLRNVYMTPHSACMGWSSNMKQEAARYLTVNTRVDPLVFSKNSPKLNIQSFGFQKDSIFVDSYCRITEGVYEAGLVPIWEAVENYRFKKEGIVLLNQEQDTDLYKALIAQTKIDDSDRKPLSMRNLWVIFALLPIGFLLGTPFFFIENYIWRKEEVDQYVRERLQNSMFACLVGKKDKVTSLRDGIDTITIVAVKQDKDIAVEKVKVDLKVKEEIVEIHKLSDVEDKADAKSVPPPPPQEVINRSVKILEDRDSQKIQQDGEWYDPFNLISQQANAVEKNDSVLNTNDKKEEDANFGKLNV